ncbi:FixH family protein [Bacteriovorax sp. DB6_IX]|uniref:FixH family protein n=1 Tax=Bacteriovorax sp. DB6_IX TaxID=1353530 RepID=UPI0009DBE3A5|nr:FixH family protein [Bacteriovorax sp. DB6_IX]
MSTVTGIHKILFTIMVLMSLASCGDSPFLSDDEPSNSIRGTDTISTQTNELILGGLQLIPRYSATVALYENNSINIIFLNSVGELTDPEYSLHLKLWMPDHGHGSFPIEITKVQDGVYKADKIFFTMPGYWDLHLQLKDGESVVEEVLWPITL